ncbi:MAG TPA: hypothetical protein VFQ78_14225 [Candidatus Udaeobacter sp.]|nr:hypothetical protein [Candidatus Udaeobacter sp.]
MQVNSDALVIPVLAEVRSVFPASNTFVSVCLFYGDQDEKGLQK